MLAAERRCTLGRWPSLRTGPGLTSAGTPAASPVPGRTRSYKKDDEPLFNLTGAMSR